MLNKVLNALSDIKLEKHLEEGDIHAMVQKALLYAALPCMHEYPLTAKDRIDFLCGDIGIEIKKGRPNKAALIKQLGRYAQSPALSALVVVTEKSLPLPQTLSDKPLRLISLQKLQGVALPVKGVAAPSQTGDVPPSVVGNLPTPAHEPAAFIPDGHALPDFLRAPTPDTPTYGTLSYNARRKTWMIQGDPAVTELAKRLFPGSDKGRRGVAQFALNARSVGDLNWLMLRYPLDIKAGDLGRWQSALEKTRQSYARRALLKEGKLPLVMPPRADFLGALRPFQKAGLQFLYHTPRALLADEMGLGKTVQAIAALAASGAYPALLIVPAHLVRNWQKEIERFLRLNGRMPTVHVIRGLKPYPLPPADIYIMHYLLLRGWKHRLDAYAFPLIIFDEIQELRRHGTEKYAAASLLSAAAERVWGLSGTPIYNVGGEIWNVINILDFQFLGDFESFSREWCCGYGSMLVKDPQMLGAHLKQEGIMLRRLKQQVLPELPDKRRVVQVIDQDEALYQQLMQPVLQSLRRLARDDLTPSERALLEGSVSQGQRQASGLAKAPYVAQFVRALVENGENVLLFAHHHLVMDEYQKAFKALRPVFITGRETSEQKEAAVQKFMDGKTGLCCISLRAAAGLNLQKATCVVFGELDWSPAVHSQAEDRAHRMGQKDSLLCYYLVSPEGSDAHMQDALGLKVSQFSGLMGQSVADDALRQSEYSAKMHTQALLKKFAEQQRV